MHQIPSKMHNARNVIILAYLVALACSMIIFDLQRGLKICC